MSEDKMHTSFVLHVKTNSPSPLPKREANKSNLCKLQASSKSHVKSQTLYALTPGEFLEQTTRPDVCRTSGTARLSGSVAVVPFSVAVVLSGCVPR